MVNLGLRRRKWEMTVSCVKLVQYLIITYNGKNLNIYIFSFNMYAYVYTYIYITESLSVYPKLTL